MKRLAAWRANVNTTARMHKTSLSREQESTPGESAPAGLFIHVRWSSLHLHAPVPFDLLLRLIAVLTPDPAAP